MGERWNPTGCTQLAQQAGLQAEDPDDASLARVPREIGREIRGRPDVRGIVGADVARQQEPVAPAAGVARDVLLAVRSAERNRRAHDTRTDFELPQLAASLRIGGLEPAVQCAEEYDVAGSDDAAAPNWKLLFDPPDFTAARRIPGDELPHVAARTGDVWRRRTDVRRAGNPRHLRGLEVHAEIVRRGIEQPRARRIRGG